MTDSRTGAPIGIDRGWDYAPGASVSDLVANLVPKLEALPERPSIDLIQSWLQIDAFAEWFSNPKGSWPLVRISDDDAIRIGAKKRVAVLSEATLKKQKTHHPELTIDEYRAAQDVLAKAEIKFTQVDNDTGTSSRVYVLEIGDQNVGGYVLVVKATFTGDGLFVESFRRLSRDAARRDAEIGKMINSKKRKTINDQEGEGK